MREMIGRRGLNSPLCGCESAAKGIGPDIEPMCELFLVDQRQHRPAVRIARSLFDGAFESIPRGRMFFSIHSLKMCEATEHGFIRAQPCRISGPKRVSHTPRQNAMCIGDGGDDLWHNVIL